MTVILIWSFTFSFLLKVIPLERNAALSFSLYCWQWDRREDFRYNLRKCQGAHIFPFLFPSALPWRGQHSRKGSCCIIKLLPKLTESFATSLGPGTEVCHTAPGSSLTVPNWPRTRYKAMREAGKADFSQPWRRGVTSCLYPITSHAAASTVLAIHHPLLNQVHRAILCVRTPGEKTVTTFYAITKSEKRERCQQPLVQCFSKCGTRTTPVLESLWGARTSL